MCGIRQLMNGVENMKINISNLKKIEGMFKGINCLDDVSVINYDCLSCTLKIVSHYPLDIINIRYEAENRFWAYNYNIVFVNSFKINTVLYGDIFLQFKKGDIFFKSYRIKNKVYIKKLNENQLLKKLLNSIDIISLEIKVVNQGEVTVSMSTYPGSITRLLLPPISKFIPISSSEIISCLHILQIIQIIISAKFSVN